MKVLIHLALLSALVCTAQPVFAVCPYGTKCSKSDELVRAYSGDKSRYGSQSPTNPYATDPPRIYDSQGNYHGQLSANPYLPDSTSNPYGQYGSQYSPDSIKNPYGAGNPYTTESFIVIPSY